MGSGRECKIKIAGRHDVNIYDLNNALKLSKPRGTPHPLVNLTTNFKGVHLMPRTNRCTKMHSQLIFDNLTHIAKDCSIRADNKNPSIFRPKLLLHTSSTNRYHLKAGSICFFWSQLDRIRKLKASNSEIVRIARDKGAKGFI